MFYRPPVTNNDRKKMAGKKIREIRKELGITQPEFGKMVDFSKASFDFKYSKKGDYSVHPIDKKTVYAWETGKSVPSKNRINAIAKLANMTSNELLFGTFQDYIHGIILFEDSLLIKSKTTKEISLYQYIHSYLYNPAIDELIQCFRHLMDSDKTTVANETLEKCLKDNLSYFDTEEICNCFKSVLRDFFSNDIRVLTASLQANIHHLETEYLPDQLEDEYDEFPQAGVQEIFEALNSFSNQLHAINNKYSKYK